VLAAPHPLAIRSALVRDPRGQGLASSYALGFQLPRWPERSLRTAGGARVERIMRAWAGPTWAATDDFTAAVAQNRLAIQVPGVVHSAMEYYRWAFRSQVRLEGHRFAAAIARPAEVPVLQVHGAADPCLLVRTAEASRRWAGPRYRLEVLPVGHFPHQEDPFVVDELLAAFLKSHPPAS
jgi:pimeloyl-ACP methyl ester carboxylesterase